MLLKTGKAFQDRLAPDATSSSHHENRPRSPWMNRQGSVSATAFSYTFLSWARPREMASTSRPFTTKVAILGEKPQEPVKMLRQMQSQ